MSLRLPTAIDCYIKAENSGEVEVLSECFAPNAVVRDERRAYEGLAAIKQWKAETKKKYNHTVTPLEVRQRQGSTVVIARLAGTFPGSPVTIEFTFVLEGDRIASLEIH